jgi:RNA polymerase sigma factor (TIGR02999 family)
MNAPQRITDLLVAWRAGDTSARPSLDREIYATLKRMALARLSGGRGPATLNPTALVNEAVARLLGGSQDWRSRAHFYALAALQMRAVLVDHARRRHAARRGGGAVAVTLGTGADEVAAAGDEFLDLHEALGALAREDARTARTIELTYFGGLSAADVAEVAGVSVATVERDLAFGRVWLKRELAR